MNTEEKARELMAERRHHDQHLQESMLNRAEAEVNQPNTAEAQTQEQARELMAEQRHHDEHVQESMRSRAEAEVNSEHETADSQQA